MRCNKITITLLIVFLFLSLLSLTTQQAHAQNVTGQNFQVLFASGSTLGFQNRVNKVVLLKIETGVLNSSSNTILIDIGGGEFRFIALNDTEIKISYTVSNVKVSGDQDNEYRAISSGSTITVKTGNNVVIQWDSLIEPWLPIMFIFGMVGLGGMFGGPLYTIHKIKKGEYYEAMRSGVILTAVGIAFVLAWLW